MAQRVREKSPLNVDPGEQRELPREAQPAGLFTNLRRFRQLAQIKFQLQRSSIPAVNEASEPANPWCREKCWEKWISGFAPLGRPGEDARKRHIGWTAGMYSRSNPARHL
jgi:hypothetical protein